MKNLRIISAFLLGSIFLLQACDDGLLDVVETFTFTHEFPVVAAETSFNTDDLINLSQESLINEYGSKIKKIEIEEVKYWVKNFEGNDTQELTNLELSVADPDGTDSKHIAHLQNIALSSLIDTPTDLAINNEGKEKLEYNVKNPPHSFSYLLDLAVNEGPASFTLAVEVRVRMTANPLN